MSAPKRKLKKARQPRSGFPRLLSVQVRSGSVRLIKTSTIACPKCGYRATEQMPLDACRFFYDCKVCGQRLKPKPGDCCVFCSYGSVPCPPKQAVGEANINRYHSDPPPGAG